MRQSFFLVLSFILLLIGCSAYNRIDTNKKKGLKTMRLAQSLQGSFMDKNKNVSMPSAFKVNALYLYEEKTPERPVVTVDIEIEKQLLPLSDSIITITLDGENIPLISLHARCVIPENLWVPVIHSKNITYQLNSYDEILFVELNDKQTNQLIAFFQKAIQYRDDIFPAIPRGQKKW